jgi:DNA-binding NtrC family response regulator
MSTILVVSKEKEVFRTIEACFLLDDKIDDASNRDVALEMLRKVHYDFLFIDLGILRGSVPANSYKTALQPFWQEHPNLEIIVMSSQEMIREAVMVVKAGASNYLTYPINADEIKHIKETVHAASLMQSELDYLRDQFWQIDSLEFVQTKNPTMKKALDKARSVAPTKSTVLLISETGAGKSVLARLIHRHSNRRNESFISVHCGAIPDTLLESELFGHEKGAFTGAYRKKIGKFELAKGGTIFLDEIGTITPSAQIKLLQILQDGTFQRVGGEETIQADARIISATNTDLKKMCDEGQFRKDLYYRLNVFPIEMPPLRERIEDIFYLVEIFLKKMNKVYSKEIHKVHPDVLKAFQNYSWPGNIRELENLIERAYILETSSVLTPESFPRELFEERVPLASLQVDSSLTISEVRQRAIDDIERNYLKELLANNNGRINDSAKAAGITPRQLHKLMKKHGIRKEKFRLLK